MRDTKSHFGAYDKKATWMLLGQNFLLFTGILFTSLTMGFLVYRILFSLYQLPFKDVWFSLLLTFLFYLVLLVFKLLLTYHAVTSLFMYVPIRRYDVCRAVEEIGNSAGVLVGFFLFGLFGGILFLGTVDRGLHIYLSENIVMTYEKVILVLFALYSALLFLVFEVEQVYNRKVIRNYMHHIKEQDPISSQSSYRSFLYTGQSDGVKLNSRFPNRRPRYAPYGQVYVVRKPFGKTVDCKPCSPMAQ